MTTIFPVERFQTLETPFYYYDLDLLRETLEVINGCVKGQPYKVHYAIKSNANQRILKEIKNAGLGIDCVSGGELKASIEAGFTGEEIVFAGVAKNDKEINAGLDAEILCFNVESINELRVINELASAKGKIANVALRINPNIDAHTHHYITTGLKENKFGINQEQLDTVVKEALEMTAINLCGIHFHIGSQIESNEPFSLLCDKVNEIQEKMSVLGANIQIINVGGGLGIDYDNPDLNPIPNFKSYFETFKKGLKLRKGQEVHFELGRSISGQCGSLITRVIYVKKGTEKKFVIVDAGFTDLIRPALYQAHHYTQNLTSGSQVTDKYDIVGPICESSDCFSTDERLPITERGDIIALRSAGAYGEIMASQYNCRELPGAYYSE